MRGQRIGSALGKYISGLVLVGLLLYPVLLTIRIRNEEKVLTEGLPGYAAYCEKVRWRMLPFVW